jgi:polyisoprenoid-binding protein YceI
MKRIITSVLLASALVASSAFAADYKVDPAHSDIGFGVKHLVGKVKGKFKEIEGSFSFDPKKPTAATGKFTAKTASVSTDNDKRDEHLRSSDFFDAQKYPELVLDKVKLAPGKGKGHYKMTGELTMHGVTKPITLDVEYHGSAKDPWGNTRAGFSATGHLNRKDYGIVWNKTMDTGSLMLGENVDLELNVEAIENKPLDAKTDAAKENKAEAKKAEEKK